jgi:hypothetical protein
MRRAIVFIVGMLACGCSYSMHEYQAAGYATPTRTAGPTRQAEWIEAKADQSVVLGVTDNTNYVDRAYAILLAQCSGEIVGLNTRYSTKLGFLSSKNTVEMRAFCLR